MRFPASEFHGRRCVAALAALAAAGAMLTGCSSSRASANGDSPASPEAARARATRDGAAPAASRPIPPLRRRVRADVLVASRTPMTPRQLAALRKLAPGGFTVLRIGTVAVAGRRIGVAAVNPLSFRAFTPSGTAESLPVWEAVARGEAAVAHDQAKGLKLPLGGIVTVQGARSQRLRIGAFATNGLPEMPFVVSDAVGAALGLRPVTGTILSGAGDPVRLARDAQRAVPGARVDLLTESSPLPTAFLRGTKAARAFGAFSYRYFPDGTIEPDAGWVRRSIVYSKVPIIGVVRCHRLMVPQLRRVLEEIEARGLSREIYSYAGCYVPRFIERDPTRSVSLHTWGIAVDFNVATNQVGTHGDMHPDVVRIFEKWGFRWGGRWSVPDPMHFELVALLDL